MIELPSVVFYRAMAGSGVYLATVVGRRAVDLIDIEVDGGIGEPVLLRRIRYLPADEGLNATAFP